MKGIVSEIIVGLIVAMIWAGIVFLHTQFPKKTKLYFTRLCNLRKLMKTIKNECIENFYFSRSDMENRRIPKEMSEYIKYKAHHSFIYIGMFFPIEEWDATKRVFYDLLNHNDYRRSIEIVIFDDKDLQEQDNLNTLAVYYGYSINELKEKIIMSRDKLLKFYDEELPETLKDRFIVKCHNEFLTSSIFIFDHENDETATCLLNFKFFGLGRESEHSFIIETNPSAKVADSLYARIITSFFMIEKKAKKINVEI